MNSPNFDGLVMPSEFYKGIFKMSVTIIGIAIVVLIILCCLSYKLDWKIKVKAKFFYEVPKLLVSFMAFMLVFFYDYTNRVWGWSGFENMTMPTFIVGVLSIIEILSSIAAVIENILQDK